MDLSILDVTLRDGGYVNDFAFPVQGARRLVSTLARVGVRRVEVGYYRPRLGSDPSVPGPKCCRRDYLRAVSSAGAGAELFVMVHPADVRHDEYQLLADHGVKGVRMVVPTRGVPGIEAHVRAAHAAGLLCSLNLIRMSERTLESLVSQARAAREVGADWLYLADSNGSMFPDRVEEAFREVAREVRLPLGFHAHDPLRLAFANALAALSGGAHLLDSSLGGMGKGAGNLSTEIIAAYFKSSRHMPYDVAEMVSVAVDVVSAWIASDHERRCESALSALLDLNVDELGKLGDVARGRHRSILVELDREIASRSSVAADLSRGAARR